MVYDVPWTMYLVLHAVHCKLSTMCCILVSGKCTGRYTRCDTLCTGYCVPDTERQIFWREVLVLRCVRGPALWRAHRDGDRCAAGLALDDCVSGYEVDAHAHLHAGMHNLHDTYTHGHAAQYQYYSIPHQDGSTLCYTDAKTNTTCVCTVWYILSLCNRHYTPYTKR